MDTLGYVRIGKGRASDRWRAMARGYGSSGSYRDWERARRAEEQALRRHEQDRRARERQLAQDEATARDWEAERKTRAIEQRVQELETLLRSSLSRDPRLDLGSLRRQVDLPPLDLGSLSVPELPPDWASFEPEPPRGLTRMFGGQQRYELALKDAQRSFANAQDEHGRRESERRKRVAEKRRDYERRLAEAKREVAAHNASVDKMALGIREGDRHAVSEYIQTVLRSSPYPEGFPDERRAGYVPESSLLAVEWYLPPVDVVPEHKSFRHIKTRKVVEPVARPVPDVRHLYQRVIAQIALRTLREVFGSDPGNLISTIVFNGRVHAIDPVTGRKVKPHLITLRATREQFAPLILSEPKFNPVECVRRHFFADISVHPDELIPVEPVMSYSMADPRAVDPVDVISDIDKRPNLLDLTPKEFEAFIENLFAKMGFDTQLFRASGDGGIDCVAYDPHPITGGKFIVQAKLYTKTVQPTHVRDLWGTVQHEGATKGIMITTSGYGPDSYKFAGGKPINLIDGSGLLALCHQKDIPARILNRGQKKPSSDHEPGSAPGTPSS
jgi:restriction system protein